jgi:hypothetical protein
VERSHVPGCGHFLFHQCHHLLDFSGELRFVGKVGGLSGVHVKVEELCFVYPWAANQLPAVVTHDALDVLSFSSVSSLLLLRLR